jgi:hypothetical protein
LVQLFTPLSIEEEEKKVGREEREEERLIMKMVQIAFRTAEDWAAGP